MRPNEHKPAPSWNGLNPPLSGASIAPLVLGASVVGASVVGTSVVFASVVGASVVGVSVVRGDVCPLRAHLPVYGLPLCLRVVVCDRVPPKPGAPLPRLWCGRRLY